MPRREGGCPLLQWRLLLSLSSLVLLLLWPRQRRRVRVEVAWALMRWRRYAQTLRDGSNAIG